MLHFDVHLVDDKNLPPTEVTITYPDLDDELSDADVSSTPVEVELEIQRERGEHLTLQ